MEIRYSEKAVKQISKINRGDRKGALILKTIDAYSKNPSGNFDLKILKVKQEAYND